MPALRWETLGQMGLPLTEIVAGRIGLIHDLFLTFPYEVRDALPEGKQDLVVLVNKSSRRARIQEIAEYPGRVVVVFAPGDAAIRDAYLDGSSTLPPNVIAAYATNNELSDRRVTSVPLGVRVSNLHRMQFVRQNHSSERTGLLYGNFTLNDEHYRASRSSREHVRHRLARRLQDAPWVNLDVRAERRGTAEEQIRYYSQIAGHRFVLSPEGNGIDCYRTWEVLYLGAIPVVMASNTMSAFADLPILFTKDYEELSEDYLERCWQAMSERTFEIEMMLKSHYFHHFLDSVSALEDPRFVCCWKEDDFNYGKIRTILRRSSRSGSDVLVETPTPPFSGRRIPVDPGSWRVSGGMRLQRVNHALEVVAGEGPGTVHLRLHTIDGGSFRFSSTITSASEEVASITVSARDGDEVLAEAVVTPVGETPLEFDFVARSSRTLLTLESDAPAGLAWLIDDFSLSAEV